MSTAVGALTLAELRPAAASALAPVDAEDPDVLTDVVDACSPPVLMLLYADPWLEPGPDARTMGPCLYVCRLEVLAVAARVEPGPGFDTLDALVTYTEGRLRADPYPWPLATVEAPRVYRIGDLPYLAARLIYRVRVAL